MLGSFAKNIFERTYAHDTPDGKETWEQTAHRVTKHVMRAVGVDMRQGLAKEIREAIVTRKFIPAGRYLYASGRPLHQVCNCLMLRAHDSREGWSELMAKASKALMTGAGIGVNYSGIRHEGALIRKSGGVASGPIPLMQMVNECGRGVMQGGVRRCLPGYAPVVMWDLSRKPIKDIEVGDLVYTRFGPKKVLATSCEGKQKLLKITTTHGVVVCSYNHRWLGTTKMRIPKWLTAKNIKPGWKMYFNGVPQSGGKCKDLNWMYTLGYFLANGCAYSSNRTHEVTFNLPANSVTEKQKNIIHKGMSKFNVKGHERPGHGACVELRFRSKDLISIFQKYKTPHQSFSVPKEVFESCVESRSAFLAGWADADGSLHENSKIRVVNIHSETRKSLIQLFNTLGFHMKESGNEIYFSAHQAGLFNSTIGRYTQRLKLPNTEYDKVPARVLKVIEYGDDVTYDIEVEDHEFIAYNHISHNSAIWAGLNWQHPDIYKFINIKNWPSEIHALKEKDFSFPATLDHTNISVGLDDMFFEAYNDDEHPQHAMAHSVYWAIIEQMLRTGEPGFSVDVGKNAGEDLANACTEVRSRDSDDICDLGSVNLSKIDTIDDLKHIIDIGTAFLLAGSVYTDVPYSDVDKVLSKNRRLGLGLMGIHEWLLKRGKQYGPDEELGRWLKAYSKSGKHANKWADEWNLNRPKKTRAIAPNGCQHPETLVVTDDGILELQEISENPQEVAPTTLHVAQEKGEYKKAAYLFRNGIVNTKKITLSSKTILEATPNHKYRVLANGEYIWKRADEMQIGDLLIVALNTYKKTSEPDLVFVRPHHVNEHNFQCPNKMSPKLAKFLGIYFGDGSNHTKGIRIHCNANDPEYIKYVADMGEELFAVKPTFQDNGKNCVSIYFSSRRLLRWLYVNALDKQYSCNIEFPYLIRKSSKLSILAFIDGFWLADGSQSNSAVYFDTASNKFAQQLVCILKSLGIEATQSNLYSSGKGTLMHRIYKVKTRRRCHTKYVQQQLEKLGLTPDFTVDEVINIEDSKNNTLDLHVPDTATYISNSCVSHNTTSIVAETTGGIEPVFCVAYKRRYMKGNKHCYQYVVDPCAKRLIEQGIDPHMIEDAYMLARDVERRVAFQAWIQQFVDHAISSTINLPAWGSEFNNKDLVRPFGSMLIRYLPQLRGITTYPDGSRGGQPLNPVSYDEANGQEGVEVVEEQQNVCDLRGGSCGD